MKRTTINDIARDCGISKSTVSRALSNKGYVSREVYARIHACAASLNYIPQKTHNKNIRDMVMVISCQLSSEAQIILGTTISNFLIRDGMKTVIAPCHFGDENIYDYINYAKEKNFGGLILLGALETKELKIALASLSCPVVLLNQDIEFVKNSSVIIEDYPASYNACKYLIENGHETIAFLSGQANASAIKDRQKAYLDCMRDHALKPYLINKDFDQKSGMWFAKYIKDNRFPYSAVIISTDEIANGFLIQAKDLAIHIPDDISCICYGDTLLAKVYSPGITTVDYDFSAMGQQLAELLIKQINKPFSKPAKRIVSPKLIIRDSIKKITKL